jgi:hypothetical protein
MYNSRALAWRSGGSSRLAMAAYSGQRSRVSTISARALRVVGDS